MVRSVMTHQFSMVPRADIPRSNFKRNSGFKTTLDSGYLVPIFVDEVLPGDTFNLKVNIFARLATPIVPIMDNVFADTFFFYVPNRLVWDNWKKFMGEQKNPGDSTDYLIPQVKPKNGLPNSYWDTGSLADYFGIPRGSVVTKVGEGLAVSALPFRAYNLIWNEWFRDQNLQESVKVPLNDGPDLETRDGYKLLRRGKRHDYFTSCLPWPQKGPGVELPLGNYAPVIPVDKKLAPKFAYSTQTGIGADMTLREKGPSSDAKMLPSLTTTDTNWTEILWGSNVNLQADMSKVTGATINTLRQAFQIQKLLERDARGGTRYTEQITSHFGVVSPDARLQRPEYLGGGSMPIHFTPIPQNSATNDTSPQGNLAATATFSGTSSGFTKSFVEHGFIIGLISIRADINYQQGLRRMWSRRTRYDHYWPVLSHLGEQAVLNKEIYAQGPNMKDEKGEIIDDKVFGYQERWAEYRYGMSMVTGKFRSTSSNPLDFWHLAQKFENLPTLSSQFIEDNPPLKRVIAVQDEPEFLLDAYFQLNCARPMPLYSVPGLIDHF